MKDLEKMIMEEISTLDEMRLIDILGFIRYLKMEKPPKQEWIVQWLEGALKTIHEQDAELQITPADIQQQIQKRRHTR